MAKATLDATYSYHKEVSEEDKERMDVLEEEVKLVRVYFEDGGVERKVEGIVLKMGCSTN